MNCRELAQRRVLAVGADYEVRVDHQPAGCPAGDDQPGDAVGVAHQLDHGRRWISRNPALRLAWGRTNWWSRALVGAGRAVHR
jgi:hypothetical protein